MASARDRMAAAAARRARRSRLARARARRRLEALLGAGEWSDVVPDEPRDVTPLRAPTPPRGTTEPELEPEP